MAINISTSEFSLTDTQAQPEETWPPKYYCDWFPYVMGTKPFPHPQLPLTKDQERTRVLFATDPGGYCVSRKHEQPKDDPEILQLLNDILAKEALASNPPTARTYDLRPRTRAQRASLSSRAKTLEALKRIELTQETETSKTAKPTGLLQVSCAPRKDVGAQKAAVKSDLIEGTRPINVKKSVKKKTRKNHDPLAMKSTQPAKMLIRSKRMNLRTRLT